MIRFRMYPWVLAVSETAGCGATPDGNGAVGAAPTAGVVS